jgi:hypothetical protein
MAKYHVCTFRHTDNQFPFCFREMSRLIQWGLSSLGHDCSRSENTLHEDRTNILFGFHEYWQGGNPLTVIRDYDCIIYQAEQLVPGGRRMPDWYYGGLHHAKSVWEYSVDNLAILHRNNIPAIHVPPAWHEKYKPIDNVAGQVKDIDVVFMGALNARRQHMLKLMGDLTDQVHVLTQVWGMERDEFLARSKMLANIHFYGSQTLELLRISHALNSGIPVLSETSPANIWEGAMKMVEYHQLPRAMVELLYSPNELADVGQRGQQIFRSTKMTDVLQRALDGESQTAVTRSSPSDQQPPQVA